MEFVTADIHIHQPHRNARLGSRVNRVGRTNAEKLRSSVRIDFCIFTKLRFKIILAHSPSAAIDLRHCRGHKPWVEEENRDVISKEYVRAWSRWRKGDDMNTRAFSEFVPDLFGGNLDFRNKSLGHIITIQRWLQNPHSLACHKQFGRSRMATSLTSRAEAELFGLSYPRFCVRLYLDEQHESFLNLRRSAMLIERFQAQGGWSRRLARDDRRLKNVTEYVDEERPKAELPGLIGDSILVTPARFVSRYNIVAEQFHSAYGEPAKTPEDKQRPSATAYIQHYWTTGLCGHAVIFMASMLLHKHANAIHALAEIAALLRDPDYDEFLITGLSPRDIFKYFQFPEVRLKAFHQVTPSFVSLENGATQCFANALRSYLLSKMPVIKAVDRGRLHGCGNGFNEINSDIYKRNIESGHGLKIEAPCPIHVENHFVLLIGCANDGVDDFLIHDPALLPYLEASASQLMNASMYQQGSDHGTKTPKLTRYCFQAVTPELVLMPLHRHASESEGRDVVRPGLYDLTARIFRELHPNAFINQSRPVGAEYLLGEFRLVQAKDVFAALDAPNWHNAGGLPLPQSLRQAVQNLQDEIINTSHIRKHWLWVQRFTNSCWIWNAQENPPASYVFQPPDVERYLVAIASGQNGTFQFFNIPTAEQDIPIAEAQPPGRQIKKSLITSFHHRSTRNAVEEWPEGVHYAELYAFMQADVQGILGSNRPSAVQAMSSLRNNWPEIRAIAENVGTLFWNKKITIRSIATFMPELTSSGKTPEEKQRRDDALGALVFLCQLASAFRALTPSHPVHTIELVGGSAINGVLPVQELATKTKSILANRKTFVELSGQLLLSLITERIYADLMQHDVRLAIEAEPGPLFVYGTRLGIQNLAVDIARAEEAGELPPGCVGLNVDIGHYMLSGVPASCLRDPVIAQRVFGVHISDHMKAHTSDCVVGSVSPLIEFQRWIAEIDQIQPDRFDRSITVEFECVKDRPTLQQAIAAIASLAP